MTHTMTIYKKDYSEIANMQNCETVYYKLLEHTSMDTPFFGIEVVSENGSNKPEEASFEGISESKPFVLDILKFLYENSIKPDSCLAIISDLISAQEK